MNTTVSKITHQIPGEYSLNANLYQPNKAQNSGKAILLIHGFLSAQEEWGDLPENLARQGYNVLTFDFRGHGKSDGDRGYYTYTSHLDDAERALSFLLNIDGVNQDNVAAIGHSFGTVATSRLLTQSTIGKKCKTTVLLSPPRKMSDSTKKIEVTAYGLLYKLTWPILLLTGKHIRLPYPFTVNDIYVSKEAIDRANSLNFLQNQMTVNNYYYMIEQVNNADYVKNIKIPTLVIVAKDDKLIPNEFSKEVFEAIPVSDKNYLEVDNTGHSLMADNNALLVEQQITDWLENHL